MNSHAERMTFVYVGPTHRAGPLVWSDGRLLPQADEAGRTAAFERIRKTYEATPRHRTWGDTSWTRSGTALIVETSLDEEDDGGRPLACTIGFEGLPLRGRAALPSGELLSLLGERHYIVDERKLSRALQRAGSQHRVLNLLPPVLVLLGAAVLCQRMRRRCAARAN